MLQIRFAILLLFAGLFAQGQSVVPLRGDTIKIYKQGGSAELVIQNKSKDSLGILTNMGNGLTRFLRSHNLNDSTIIIGNDTLHIRLVGSGGGGGGGGSVDTFTVISTKANVRKVIDSMKVVNDVRYKQLSDSVVASGYMTNGHGQKVTDSMKLVNDARYFFRSDTVGFTKVATNGHLQKVADSLQALKFGLHIVAVGASGDSLLIGVNDSTLNQRKIRDSLAFHHIIAPDGALVFYSAASGGGGGSGNGQYIGDSITQTSHGFSVGDIISKGTTTWAKADTISKFPDGIVSSVIDANDFVVVTHGVFAWTSGKTVGADEFLSTTAGAMTTTSPVISIPVGKALTSGLFLVSIKRAVDFSGTSGTGSAGADTNYLYTNSTIVPDGVTDNSAALQSLWNTAAAKNKGIIVTPGQYVVGTTLNAPTTGSLSVSWTYLDSAYINYTAKSGYLFFYNAAPFHDVRIRNPHNFSSADTTNIGNGCYLLQSTTRATNIKRFEVEGGELKDFGTAFLIKGVQDSKFHGIYFPYSKGHDAATTTSAPATSFRLIHDSVGDANKKIAIFDNLQNGYTGSNITTLKTGGPMDGLVYGNCSGCDIYNNYTFNDGHEHYVLQNQIAFIDSLTTTIHDNHGYGQMPVGSTNTTGVKLRSPTFIRAEGQHLSIKDNIGYQFSYGIESLNTSNFITRDLTISGNELSAPKDTAMTPVTGIYVSGIDATHRGIGAIITGNKLRWDSVTMKSAAAAINVINYDSTIVDGNQIYEKGALKTLGALTGISLDHSSGITFGENPMLNVDIANAFTSATYRSELGDTAHAIRTAQPWPAEGPIGTIYNKTQWLNTTDFTDGPTSNLAFTLNNGFIDVTGTGVTFANYATILKNRPTQLPRFTTTAIFQMVTTPAAGTVGFGIGVKTANLGGAVGDFTCYINTTNSGSSGFMNIVSSDGAHTYASGSSANTVHAGDYIQLSCQYQDSIVTCNETNITTGVTSTPLSWTNTIASTQGAIFTSSNFSLTTFGPATYEIKQFTIYSDAKRNGNLVLLGDSKTEGFKADFFNKRFGWQLGNTYPSTLIWAGGSNTTSDVLLQQDEMTNLNGAQYIMSIGCNDIRFGTSLAQLEINYAKIVSILQGGGAKVYHMVFPEDSTGGVSGAGVGLTAFKNWVAATYPATYIDTWTALSTSNVLKSIYNSGDGVHPNQAGNDVIVSTVIASGLIKVISPNRLSEYRTVDNNIKIAGDSVFTYSTDKATNYINHWTSNGSSTTGLPQDNGTAMGISATPFTQMPGSILTVNGAIGVPGGSGAGYIIGDFNTPYDGTFVLQGSNRSAGFYSTHTSGVVFQVDSLGRTAVGKDAANVGQGAYLQLNKGYSTPGRAPFKHSLFQSVILAIPEKGAFEVDSAGHYYLTDSIPFRDSIMRASFVRKAIHDSLSGFSGGGGVTLPITDASALFKNSTDATKLIAFNLGSLTTGTTRTWTFPDVSGTFARNDAAQTFTGIQTFSSSPIVPTATAGDNSTKAASTAYADAIATLKANLASPTFTGTPTLPTGTIGVTQTAGNSSTALATTAFVTTADNLKANLASPTLTGTPAAPTATAGTNTTQIATTAFVAAAAVVATNNADHVIFAETAAGTAVANTTTSTSIIGTGTGSRAIATAALTVGKTISYHGWVTIGTTTGSQSLTIFFFPNSGGTGSGNTLTIPGSLSGQLAEITFNGTILTTGTSGTMSGYGTLNIPGSALFFTIGLDNQTINTTVTNTVDVNAQWGTASAANTITLRPQFTVEMK